MQRMNRAQTALVLWDKAKKILADAKDAEKYARAELLEALELDRVDSVGSKKISVFKNAELVYSRSKETTLTIDGAMFSNLPIALRRAIVIKMSVSAALLNSLNEYHRDILTPYLTTKPSSATIELRVKTEKDNSDDD
jgi:hypothetical protein